MLSLIQICEINKQRIKSRQNQQTYSPKTNSDYKQQTLQNITILKIGKLLLTADSPKLNNLAIQRDTVNGQLS